MAKLFATSGDPDQTRRLIWVCTVCQLPFYGSPNYNGLMLATLIRDMIKIHFSFDPLQKQETN